MSLGTLPSEAQRMLKEAHAEPNLAVRRKAVDAAIDLIKLKYPNNFRQEHNHDTQEREISIPRFIRSENR